MRITTLIENTQGDNENLKYEHGLSMFIETKDCKILFDTGQSGDIVENAEKLNIDLSQIDIIVLSHGHYDHCGGVRKLLNKYNIHPKLVVGKNFFENSFKYRELKEDEKQDNNKETYKYIGIDFDKQFIEDKGLRVIEAFGDEEMEISENIYVFSNFEKFYDFETVNDSMKYLKNNSYNIDYFEEEICIGIKKDNDFIILLGCGHPGFLNMIRTIEKRSKKKITGIIGGTHLKSSNDYRIKQSIEVLKKMNIKILGLSHCTGEKASKLLSDNFEDLFLNKTGKILEI